jgi:glycine dehydrogenase subunit 2
MSEDKLIFEKSTAGRNRSRYVHIDTRRSELPQDLVRKNEPNLPELSELEVVRHFTHLAHKNFSIDTHFYPLGSCTMKYNPKMMETVASLDGFKSVHPLLSLSKSGEKHIQGELEVLYELEKALCEITGMAAFTTQPMAGAHGELTGILLIEAYHNSKGSKRKNIIVPDSSHGTNPASAAVAGYDVITVQSLDNGEIDVEDLGKKIDSETAAIMLTCPSTHGVFETQIKEIAEIAHKHDALLYYDGANLNAILGKIRPGDIGFDVVHVNVHKTFATPHGGGGPGAGPVGVTEKLKSFLPNPGIDFNDNYYSVSNYENSIGKIAPFFGNYSILLRSLAYILQLGKEGLVDTGEKAVLAANYVSAKLKHHFKLQFERLCMHESVFTLTKEQRDKNIRAVDIAKFLIDNGVHAPTVYFPLTVKESMMIEPTETENKIRLDRFVELMSEAADLIEKDPERLLNSPKNLPIGRPDEAQAARNLDVRWKS